MYAFYNELSSFISERFDKNISKLKKSKDYEITQLKYSKLLSEFTLNLSSEQRKQLNTILSLQNALNSKELDFIYIIGLTDGLKLCK